MRMSNQTFDVLKVVQKILVLLATFYTTLANIWSLPFGDEISKTCLALATFLLGILEISTATYKSDLLAQGEVVDDYEAPTDVVDHEVDEGVG